MTIPTILLILAFVCFVLAATGFSWRRTNLIAAGLALAVASVLAGSGLIG